MKNKLENIAINIWFDFNVNANKKDKKTIIEKTIHELEKWSNEGVLLRISDKKVYMYNIELDEYYIQYPHTYSNVFLDIYHHYKSLELEDIYLISTIKTSSLEKQLKKYKRELEEVEDMDFFIISLDIEDFQFEDFENSESKVLFKYKAEKEYFVNRPISKYINITNTLKVLFANTFLYDNKLDNLLNNCMLISYSLSYQYIELTIKFFKNIQFEKNKYYFTMEKVAYLLDIQDDNSIVIGFINTPYIYLLIDELEKNNVVVLEKLNENNLLQATKLRDTLFKDVSEKEKHTLIASLNKEEYNDVFEHNNLKFMEYFVVNNNLNLQSQVIGIIGLYEEYKDNNNCWLGWFGVDANHRSKGIGIEMLQSIINIAKVLKYKTISLYCYTSKEYQAALALYEKVGFNQYLLEKNYIYMRKSL